MAKHLESDSHETQATRKLECEELERKRNAQIHEFSHMPTVPPRPGQNILDQINSTKPRMFQPVSRPMSTLSEDTNTTFGTETETFTEPNAPPTERSQWKPPMIPTSIRPLPPHDPALKHQQLLDYYTQIL